MKRILLSVCAISVFLSMATHGIAQEEAADETAVKKYPKRKEVLDLGEPTPQERSAAQRHEEDLMVEESGEYITGEDMAEDTTAEEREFGE